MASQELIRMDVIPQANTQNENCYVKESSDAYGPNFQTLVSNIMLTLL